jgi:hypothetical protein
VRVLESVRGNVCVTVCESVCVRERICVRESLSVCLREVCEESVCEKGSVCESVKMCV